MDESTESLLEKITPEALASRAFTTRRKLPPILSEKDKVVLQEVRQLIDGEKKKIGSSDYEVSSQKFAIYREAFDLIINHVTVYKDIMSDIKREYEDCMTAITNGHNESAFLQSKIKSLSCLPVTIAGYRKRKEELEHKLEILTDENKTLEEKLAKLKKIKEENDENEESSQKLESPIHVEEKRPIPGLSVEQWTDEKILKQAVSQLNKGIQEFLHQQKTSYVPISKKIETEKLLEERMLAKQLATEEGKMLRRKNLRLRLAIDALNTYKKKCRDDPEFNQDIKEFMRQAFERNNSLQRQVSLLSESGQFSAEEDDPSKEKEAEMILEYMDKFNELFTDREYSKAAIHAANSPRGVLRNHETLNRFKEVSDDYSGTPSPLLMYSEALMHSSNAQDNVIDGETSVICCRCALNENRPDLVEHWVSKDCLTSSEEIGDVLVMYSKKNPQHRSLCLSIALKLYTDLSCHLAVCTTYFKLNHLGSLVEYAKNTAKFIKNDYIWLLSTCPDPSLVWSLCRQISNEQEHEYTNQPLPLRFDEAIMAMLSNEKGQRVAHDLLDDLYAGSLVVDEDEVVSRSNSEDSLHYIVYHEADGAQSHEDDCDWSRIAEFCANHNLGDVAIEIKAAIVVKMSVTRALDLIAQHEKEQFDYYT
uniref:Clathrin heavy chain linker domain-containing protein 1-like n=1 Tax=Phallusia mammillata TaxID=59560 RepID=A0A6F9D8X5_9ASCI|nr:clathrin heavy chain linker domain-containing protein 1-like [Phallusia mammillata]